MKISVKKSENLWCQVRCPGVHHGSAPGGDGARLPAAAGQLRMDARCRGAAGEGDPSSLEPPRGGGHGLFAPRLRGIGPGEIGGSRSHFPPTEGSLLAH